MAIWLFVKEENAPRPPRLCVTSLLRPGGGARAADLTRAQAALATPTASQLAVMSDPLAATVENPLGAAAQVRGMLATEDLGPFTDPYGLDHHIIILPITTSNPFAFGSAASPFGVLPVVEAPASATKLTLGAGSVWFETGLLVPGVAAGSFSGFRISGGTLSASVMLTLQGNTYVAPAGTTLTLTATLAPPTAGTGTGSGTPGGDLIGAIVALPATVTIVFTQTTATVEALGSSSVSLYGNAIALTLKSAPPQALNGFPAILIPCTPSVATFGFATVASQIFVPSGQAPIDARGWSLPIALTTVAALGEASGAGSLVLELGAGAEPRLRRPPGQGGDRRLAPWHRPRTARRDGRRHRPDERHRLSALAAPAARHRPQHGRMGHPGGSLLASGCATSCATRP